MLMLWGKVKPCQIKPRVSLTLHPVPVALRIPLGQPKSGYPAASGTHVFGCVLVFPRLLPLRISFYSNSCSTPLKISKVGPKYAQGLDFNDFNTFDTAQPPRLQQASRKNINLCFFCASPFPIELPS